jgi:uncharacterized protein YneF (UPF0154 family)
MEGLMHGFSPHELAFWISIGVGGGVSVAVGLALGFWVALRKPSEPKA